MKIKKYAKKIKYSQIMNISLDNNNQKLYNKVIKYDTRNMCYAWKKKS